MQSYRLVSPVLAAASAALVLWLSACSFGSSEGGCSKDTDCKGNRVCVDGTCQDGDPSGAQGPAGPVQGNVPGAQAGAVGTVEPPPKNKNGVVRANPAFGADKVTELPRGTTVTVLGKSPDGAWRHISWTVDGGGQGWIHQDVLTEPGRTAPAANQSPNKRFPCMSDADCYAPYQCGYQGNCMKL